MNIKILYDRMFLKIPPQPMKIKQDWLDMTKVSTLFISSLWWPSYNWNCNNTKEMWQFTNIVWNKVYTVKDEMWVFTLGNEKHTHGKPIIFSWLVVPVTLNNHDPILNMFSIHSSMHKRNIILNTYMNNINWNYSLLLLVRSGLSINIM